MVWRRLLVPASHTLEELHGVLQVAMGWEGIHLYRFWIHAVHYGSFGLCVSSPRVPLDGFRFRRGAKFVYDYDMTDFWRHEVRIEDRLEPEPGRSYPLCIAGDHACPPEDCGGPEGYADRLSMAPSATPAGLPALAHGLPLLPRLPGSGSVGELAPPSGGDAARAGGPRSDALGRHPRHPERQDDGKGGARGFDAAKKVKGRKRHIAVDTSGFLLGVLVHAADIQDADSAGALLRRIKRLYCWLRAVFADSIDNRMPVILACFLLGLTLIIVRRIAGDGFILVPRRWVVERSFGWLGRWRRLSKDHEERTDVAEAMVTVATIRIMLHRLVHPNRRRLPSPDFYPTFETGCQAD